MDITLEPNCLSLSWEKQGIHWIDKSLIKELDKLGCISNIRSAFPIEKLQDILKKVNEPAKKCLHEAIKQLSKCQSVTDMYNLLANYKDALK